MTLDDREHSFTGDVPFGTPKGAETRRPDHIRRRLRQVGLTKGGGLMINECDCMWGSHC